MIYDLLELYQVKSGMGNKSRDDFSPNKFDNHIIMFKEIFYNSKLPDKNDLSTTVYLKPGELERFDIKSGDILLTSSSETSDELAMSSVALEDYPNTVYSGFAKRLRPITNLTYPQYMRYWFRSKNFRDYIDSTVSMTTRANLNISILSGIKIDLPNLNSQIAIANILSSLDDKIKLNIKINKTLEELAQTLYKRWFLDFEFPNEIGEPYKSSGGEMIKSEKGQIPKGWSIDILSGILKSVKESTKPGNHLNNRKYVPIDTLQTKRLVLSEYKSHDEAQSSLILFEKYDILVGAMRVYFHKVNLSFWKGVTRTTSFVLRSKNQWEIPFNLLTINQVEAIDYANGTSKGSTMPYAVWDGAFEKYKFINPSEKVKRDFNNIVMPILEIIYSNNTMNIKLSKLRDELLPKLMNGEIEVPIEE